MKERIGKKVRNKTEKETGLEMKETRTTVNEIKIEQQVKLRRRIIKKINESN